MTEELKKCPECGDRPTGVVNSSDRVLITCANYLCSRNVVGKYMEHKKAIDEWNKGASDEV